MYAWNLWLFQYSVPQNEYARCAFARPFGRNDLQVLDRKWSLSRSIGEKSIFSENNHFPDFARPTRVGFLGHCQYTVDITNKVFSVQ